MTALQLSHAFKSLTTTSGGRRSRTTIGLGILVALMAIGGPTALAAPSSDAALSVVFIPDAADDPSLVIDFIASQQASATLRTADVAFMSQSARKRIRVEDQALGRPGQGRELLPTPAAARATEITGAWMVTVTDLGDWQGPRPPSRRPLTHDGPAVVAPTTARLTIDGTLLDLPTGNNAGQTVRATLYGTWRGVKGRVLLRRGAAHAAELILAGEKELRIIEQQGQGEDAQFVIDTRAQCGRVLPAAAIVGWREEGRSRPRRAQVFSPAWTCGEATDIASITGETRKGTRSVPLHGVWIRSRR